MKLIATFGVLALLGVASLSAAALTITGGPYYAVTQQAGSPVTGTCTVTGNACLTAGATMTCTGLNPARSIPCTTASETPPSKVLAPPRL